jgi:uncharacterized membrane protein YphA (DoxX/SURF4 family)
MNWRGKMPAGVGGFEYHLLAGTIAIAIVLNGAGAYSMDRVLDRAWRRQSA